MKRWIGLALLLVVSAVASADEDAPAFFRGLNLNGPAVTIDGHRWDGGESKQYLCRDKAFENQAVALVPPTDSERARMIRSSRWGGNRIELTDIPAGTYSVFLYLWEDNDSETFSIAVNGQQVVARYKSGSAGHWERLGPWYTSPRDGQIILTSRGGAANFSGIEIWRGRYDGESQALSEEELAFFENRIRPLLVDKCYECHSAESKELQGELLVDSRATIRRGGATGPGVVPRDLKASLLIEAVRYENPDLQMPPDEKLSDQEIADLEQWVRRGAPDPRGSATRHRGKQIDLTTAREFWSLKPIVAPPSPDVRDPSWPRTPIDRLVLAQLESQGRRPAEDAERRVLIRRATYDLIGLPPTPEEVAEFVSDPSDEAFSRLVDRLLESPRYGERWGRHWLDVVRYADTAGDNSDYPIPQMRRYRDWVIDALNRDLPYDQFVREQLAGDLLGGDTDEERHRRIIATGYIANARRFGSRVDDYPQHLTIEDTIDNLGRCFLGMTLSCARCHDHKFDPVTTRDYYGLYGIFNSTRYPWPGIELDKRQRDLVPLVPLAMREQLQQQLTARTKEQQRLDGEVKKLKELVKNSKDDEKKQAQEKLKEAELQARDFKAQPALFELAYAVADAESANDAAVQIKGDPAKPGDLEPRHFLTVLGGQLLPDDCQESGRRQLAEWIVSPDNPLTARVMVNRIWQHHFGEGIVPTPNDFGRQGKPPSNPQLLDHLAVCFRDSGWSVKAMHRLIMNSRVYQIISRSGEEEPNVYSFPRRRLDAESIRDTLLALGGNLDLSIPGEHPFPKEDSWDFTQHKPFKAVYESNHRSVYLMTQRIQRHPFLAIFDGADPSTSTAARMTSTTPLQALFLLNDPLVHEQSQRVADRICSQAESVEPRVQYAYELLFARPPTAAEVSAAKSFLADAESLLGEGAGGQHAPRDERGGAGSESASAEAWRAYVRALFRLNEFVYID